MSTPMTLQLVGDSLIVFPDSTTTYRVYDGASMRNGPQAYTRRFSTGLSSGGGFYYVP